MQREEETDEVKVKILKVGKCGRDRRVVHSSPYGSGIFGAVYGLY